MHALAFADSTRPARTTILRLPLLDYSIGHELLLLRQRNPLVLLTNQEFAKLPALEQRVSIIRAVLVCSRTWEENKRPHRWLRVWKWLNRRANYASSIAEFRNHRAAGTTFPMLKEPEKSGRTLGSPLLARLAAISGFDFDLPLGMLQWIYFSQAEVEGGVQVENNEERQIREEIAQAEADWKRENAGKDEPCPA